MVSSYTPNLGIQNPATGDQTNSWGVTVDTNMNVIDNAVAGLASIALPAQSGYPTVVLTFSQGTSNQQLPNRQLTFTGTLTANTLVLLPSGRRFELAVQNSTSGAFSTTVGVSNGSGGALGNTVVVAQGATMNLFSDGTNVVVRALTGPNSATPGNLMSFADATGGVAQDSGVQASALVPSGALLGFAGASAPTGWLMCDGSSYSAGIYPALFAAIGYTYGGSGSNFNVPDLRGRVLAGNDSATGRLNASGQFTNAAPGAAGGEGAHTLVTGELAAHNHSATDGGHSHGVTDPTHDHFSISQNVGGGVADVIIAGGSTTYSGGPNTGFIPISVANAFNNYATSSAGANISVNTGTANVTIGNTGSGNAHNNVQPTLIGNWIIKT